MRFFLVNMIICLAAYLVLISNELTNTYDGMWQGSYYVGYPWVISIGRWFWPVVGKLRLNMSPEPFTSIISLMMYVLGSCIVSYWFRLGYSWKSYALVLISIIQPAVCVTLSYRYMSPTFAGSYLLSVLGAWVLSAEWRGRLIVSIILLTVSMGCYQATLGVTCLLILLYSVYLMQRESCTKKLLRFMGASVLAIVLSCLLYKIIWDIVLKICNINPSNYRGADSLSIYRIVTTFPESFVNTYKVYIKFLIARVAKYNAYQYSGAYKIGLLMYLIFTFILGGVRIAKKGFKGYLLYAFLIALIPAAVNVSMILAADTGSPMIQMIVPMTVSLPFLVCVVEFDQVKEVFSVALTKYYQLFFVLLLCGNFLMISIDQHVMLTSRQTTLAITNRIAEDIDYSQEPKEGYVFLGKPSDNPLFRKDELWQYSNEYAQYGNFYIGTNGNRQSYYGLLRDAGLGIKLNMDDSYWHKLEEEEAIRNTPSFPNEGYIQAVDDVVVVKLSNW